MLHFMQNKESFYGDNCCSSSFHLVHSLLLIGGNMLKRNATLVRLGVSDLAASVGGVTGDRKGLTVIQHHFMARYRKLAADLHSMYH